MIESPEDETNVYTPEEKQTLTQRLFALVRAIAAGEMRARPPDTSWVCELHASLFSGIRDHAGRHRCAGRGSERVVFGPHRSTAREQVEAELTKLWHRVQVDERHLVPSEDDYEARALSLAVEAHAIFIRVHPFEDGNGRVGRLLASHLLVRHGLRPVPLEAVKEEYLGALNHYYLGGDLQPLLDLHIRLYPVDR